MATLRGTWKFHYTLSVPNDSIAQHVNFTNTHIEANDEVTKNYSYLGVSVTDGAIMSIVYSSSSGEIFPYSDNNNHQWYSGYGENVRTITFTEEQEVSVEFYEWFTLNASPVFIPTIKPGTYRFADVLTKPSVGLNEPFNFTVSTYLPVADVSVLANCSRVLCGVDAITEETEIEYYVASVEPDISGIGFPTPNWLEVFNGFWLVDSYDEGIQTITIPYEQTVTRSFGEWFSENTYMVSKNGKSGVTIEWDGNTEGLFRAQLPSEPLINWYRVSDRRFTNAELTDWSIWVDDNQYYTPDVSTYDCIDRYSTNIVNENAYVLADCVIVVTRDCRWEVGTESVVPAGVYLPLTSRGFFVSKIVFPNADAVPPEKIKLDITQNGITTLVTAGKYCDKNIVVNVDVPVGDNRIDKLVQGTISGDYVSNKVTSVKDYAFYKCNDISSISLPNCTDIGIGSFSTCNNLESVDLPICTNIKGNSAFRDATKLKTVNIPNVTTITDGTRTFHATKLEEINLPNLNSIGTSTLRMFANCDYLKKLDLRKLGGTTISSYTFYSDDSLKTLILGGSELNPLENINAFENAALRYGTGYIYVPDELVESYKTATNWATLADQIKPMSELEE